MKDSKTSTTTTNNTTMANLHLLFTLLLLYFTSSTSLRPLYQSENSNIGPDEITPRTPNPDEAGGMNERTVDNNISILNSDDAFSADHPPEIETLSINPDDEFAVPRFVRFRPINRHFIHNRPFSLRFSNRHRPCKQYGTMSDPMTMLPRRETSDGNVAISNSDNGDGPDSETLPSKWLRLHRRQHHRRHRHRGFVSKYVFDEEKVKDHEKKRGGEGLMKRIRKFLEHF